MVELHEMAHLVRGKVVEHEGRRENEAPGERQYARVGARAPPAGLITYADPLDRKTEFGRIMTTCCPQIALRLALQKVADAALDMRWFAGDAKHALAALVDLGPCCAARATAVADPQRLTPQPHLKPLRETRRPPHPPH